MRRWRRQNQPVRSRLSMASTSCAEIRKIKLRGQTLQSNSHGFGAVENLPLQASVEIETGDGQPWPRMIVSLMQGTGSSQSGIDMAPVP